MSVTRLQVGAQSATYKVVATDPETKTRLDEVEWAALPSGKLKDVLTQAYLKEDGSIDPDAFLTAFGTAGGFVISTLYYDTTTALTYWLLSDNLPGEPPTKGVPYLVVNPTGLDRPVIVRIVTSYSASE